MPASRLRSLLGLVAAASALGLACATATAGTATRRSTDPLGWSLAIPATLHLERSQSPPSVRLSVFETTVASFRPRTPIRSGSTATSAWLRVDAPRDRAGSFPTGAVALRITHMEGGPAPSLELPESQFPLRLSRFGGSSLYPGTTPRPVERTVVADGRTYVVDAWIGKRASAARRAALARVVASLSFPPLHAGETVGSSFVALRRASRYAVGSVTRFRVQGQPFYLVHAPGGFYAVGWMWQSLAGGYKSRCNLWFDPRGRQFFCTNMRARWDRVGRVLVVPRGAARGDPLNIAVAKRAWDGHVLVAPGTARFAGGAYAHRLWPAVYPRR